MINNTHYQELLKIINQLTYSHSTWEIFYDFLEMSTICISNTVDLNNYDEREKQYLQTIKKYIPEHQKLFPDMFAELILALEYEYQSGNFVDILGSLFHALELHNKYKGQFFTPQHICTMMGKMLIGNNDKTIEEKGYIPVLEPCCGSGAMVLGFTQAMRDCGYNHSQQMFVTGIDIDLKCVFMCYLQLSLYGIPAVVIHGNSLTVEEWSHWYTPAYILDGWSWRSHHSIKQSEKILKNSQQTVIMPTSQEIYEQLDLFTNYD